MKLGKSNFFLLLVLSSAFIVIYVGVYQHSQNRIYQISQLPPAPTSTPQTQVFSTKKECEQTTSKTCDFQTCDYIPSDKTTEEVCGKDFQKGWVPIQEVSEDDRSLSGLQNANVPPIPKANILFDIDAGLGKSSDAETIEVSVKYKEFPDWNYSYSVRISSLQGALLAVYPPTKHIPSVVELQVKSASDRDSDILIIKNYEFWSAVGVTDNNYVGKHTFKLGKSGKTNNLTYTIGFWKIVKIKLQSYKTSILSLFR